MVIEAAPVVPGEEDGGTIPIGPLHHGIDQTRDIGLSCAHECGWMLAIFSVGCDPGDCWQGAFFAAVEKLLISWILASCPSCLTVSNCGRGFQMPGTLTFCCFLRTRHLIVLAIGLGTLIQVVGPAYLVLIKKVAKIGPGIIILRDPFWSACPIECICTASGRPVLSTLRTSQRP